MPYSPSDKELDCKGTHKNNGIWMPCAHEQVLSPALRARWC
ncbi:hypothetical protein KBY58_03695 [Cyanobium sp. HWJ4-Hawea]|nr:DUF3721 domain-containing protein [Cyanobium sp. HWJ4-Hawea]MCP9808534.1 hypothetical protein [Cyanobium sp. HWJ4-Hawea]